MDSQRISASFIKTVSFIEMLPLHTNSIILLSHYRVGKVLLSHYRVGKELGGRL
jgi:hypothetical protein